MIRDHKLRQDVIDELDFEPSLDASHIAVGVHDGVVTLTASCFELRRQIGCRASGPARLRCPRDRTGD